MKSRDLVSNGISFLNRGFSAKGKTRFSVRDLYSWLAHVRSASNVVVNRNWLAPLLDLLWWIWTILRVPFVVSNPPVTRSWRGQMPFSATYGIFESSRSPSKLESELLADCKFLCINVIVNAHIAIYSKTH